MQRESTPGRLRSALKLLIAAALILSAVWIIVDEYVLSRENLDQYEKSALQKKHNIIMYAWDYRPGFQPQAIGPPNREIERVAEEYVKLNPDVRIDFRVVGVRGDATEGEWMKPQLMERIAPDIIGANTEVVWPDVDKGWWVSFEPYMDKPNPYIPKGEPGSEQWWDLFANPALTKAKRAPNGQLYSLSLDLVETGIFYNKDIFRKCGIDVPDKWQGPKDWQEFLRIQRRIKEHGYVPLLMRIEWARDWAQDYLFDQLFYEIIEEIDREKGPPDEEEYLRGYLFPKELCWLIKNGYFSPASRRYREVWRLMWEWRQVWNRDISNMDWYRLFLIQKAAMIWNGSWMIRRMKFDSLVKFDWGIFYLPPITEKTSPYACGAEPAVIGGAGVQYSVSNSAVRKNQVEQVMDFLYYLTRPDNAERIINEAGIFIPNIKGAKMSPGLEPFAEIIKHRYCTVKWIASLRTEFNDVHQRLIELYLGDGISLDEFLEKVDENMNREADELIALHTGPGAKDFWDFSDPKWGEGWNKPGPSDAAQCPPSCR
ncbi:carbohydrate ABC transporter substrate-binding protein [bacterium]|nr:carbohydrate ABC transporter substrate-binding protein [bacterium]